VFALPKKKPIKDQKTYLVLKEVEKAMLAIRRYPVASAEKSKNESKEKIKKLYSKNGDSIRQNIILFIHEGISKVGSTRALVNFENTKAQNPKADPGQIRLSVYKSMFDYDTSLEGIIELTLLLGELDGDEPAKLLSHLFTHFCSSETETNHILRNATLDALGNSKSPYALRALLKYASFTESEKILARLTQALIEWDEKADELKLPKKDRDDLRGILKKTITREETLAAQYG
jgi:hypothetical protein